MSEPLWCARRTIGDGLPRLGRLGRAQGNVAQLSFILVPGRVTMHGRTVVPALGYGSPVNVQMVDRWRTSDQKLRWCASAVWATERQFRRVKPYRHLPLLKQALHRTLTTTTSAAA